MVFPPDELAQATNSYSRSCLIGKGGFGKVYKATLRKCMTVAIKVLTQVRPIPFMSEMGQCVGLLTVQLFLQYGGIVLCPPAQL